MAIAELYSGTEAVSTTEWSITTDTAGPDADTTDGVFQVWLDLNDMVAGDELTVKLYEKVQSGGTQRLAASWTLTGAQSNPAWVMPSFILLHGWDVTLTAVSGTITVLWSVRQVA